MLVERSRQPLERLRADFAGHARSHHAPPDEAFELRRVALVLCCAGAVGEAVAECEHHGIARQMLQLGALAASGKRQCEDRGSEAPSLTGNARC
jgi:hypothetical protein